MKKVYITEGDLDVLDDIYKYFKDKGEQEWHPVINLKAIIKDIREVLNE